MWSLLFPTGDTIWTGVAILAATLLGVVLSMVAVAYFLTVRKNPLASLKAFGGGSLISTLSAAIGTRAVGDSLPISWAQTSLVTLCAFLLGSIAFSALALLLVHVLLLRPIQRRYGVQHTARFWVEFWRGIEPISVWIRDCVRLPASDAAWDEFARASLDLERDLFEIERGAHIAAKGISVLGKQDRGEQNRDRMIKVLEKALGPSLSAFCAKLTLTTLNFSVWRVNEDSNALEHLLSLPVTPHGAYGHGRREDLPLWTDLKARDHHGSLAAAAMFQQRYLACNTASCNPNWPKRKLGADYDAVGAMPVPPVHAGEEPWAVICVEARDGVLPIESETMRRITAKIASTVDQLSDLLCVNRIPRPVVRPQRKRPVGVEVETKASSHVWSVSESIPSGLSEARASEQVPARPLDSGTKEHSA